MEAFVNQGHLFRLALALVAFAVALLLMRNRQVATLYAGLLYNCGLLDPTRRDSTAPARKVAWLLCLLALVALGWFGYRLYEYYKNPEGAGETLPPYRLPTPPGVPSPYAPGRMQPPAAPNQPRGPQPAQPAPPNQPSAPAPYGR